MLDLIPVAVGLTLGATVSGCDAREGSQAQKTSGSQTYIDGRTRNEHDGSQLSRISRIVEKRPCLLSVTFNAKSTGYLETNYAKFLQDPVQERRDSRKLMNRRMHDKMLVCKRHSRLRRS